MSSKSAGFSLIELVVAIGLFVVLASTGVVAVVGGLSSNRLADEQAQATLYAEEGIEAVRSIKNQGWESPFLTGACTECGVTESSGIWNWNGAPTSRDKYQRTISIAAVERDGVGAVVEAGGVPDENLRKVTSRVSWSFSPQRENTVEIVSFLSNFRAPLLTGGSWATPAQSGALDLAGNNDGVKVQIQGNYAYVIRSSGSPRFVIVDITDFNSPSLVGSLDLSSVPINLFVDGQYAYVVGTQNANELEIISVSDPAVPIVVGQFDLPGNGDANGIYVVGPTAYVTKDAQAQNSTFFVLDITNPAAISQLASLRLAGNLQEVVVDGDFAYIASTDNTAEVQVVSVVNPSAPGLVGSLNLSGNTDAYAITKFGDSLVVGHGDTARIVTVNTPSSPVLFASFVLGGQIKDVALAGAQGGELAFFATDNFNEEFVVVSLADVGQPSLFGSLDVPGNTVLSGIAYSELYDEVVAVGDANDANNAEVMIFIPN